MSAVQSPASRLRLDLFSAGSGLLTIPAALLVAYVGIFGINPGMILLSSLATLASLAAFFSAVFSDRNTPVELAPHLGARRGVRVGLLTLLVGGATLVLATSLLSFGLFESSLLAVPALAVLLPILGLMLLPVLLAAMVFGWIGGWLESQGRSPLEPLDQPESETESAKHSNEPALLKTALPYILFLSSLCYASPLAFLLIPEPQEEVAAETPLPPPPIAPIQTDPVPPPAPPPPYQYEIPEGFLQAGANRISLIRSESIEGVIPHAPARISPDSKLLAFCRERFRKVSVVIVQTNNRQEVANINVSGTPSALAWSEDSTRLVYLCLDEERYAGVLDSKDGSNVELPIPSGERLPSQSELAWPFENQVVFVTSQNEDAFLDLETLRVHPLSESEEWSMLTEERRAVFHARAQGNYFSSDRWSVAPHVFVTSYQPPNHFQRGWKHDTATQMAVKDHELAYENRIDLGQFKSGYKLIATPDRSIFIHLHDDSAEFLYMGLRDEPELRATFSLSQMFPGEEVPQELVTHLENKTLAAFVCASITNPLTGKVVGPDRNQVRAIARLAMAGADKVELWISEELEQVREGDVVADLHYWQRNEPQSLSITELEDWWTPMPPLGALEPGLAVKRGDVPPRSAQVPASRAVSPSPRIERLPNRPEPPAEDLIKAFVQEHHRKASNRNLDGYAADYAPQVEYFDHGKVTPQFIREDQRKYQEKYPRKVTETVQGKIAIRAAGETLYSVTYELYSAVEGKEEWNWVEATSDVTLVVRVIGNSPSILMQSSKVRNVKHGEP